MVRRKIRSAEDPHINAVVTEFARKREVGRAAVDHIRFVHENLVAQEMVHRCLELGLSQGETATQLRMSKREVNRLATTPFPFTPFLPFPANEATRTSFDELRAAFLRCVWTSLNTSQ